MVGSRVLAPIRRNDCASMAIQQWPKFPSKKVSCRDATRADVVAIHQYVLKSTTSDKGRVGNAQNRRSIWSISSVWFIWLVSSNQIDQKDQTDQIDQIDQTNRELPLGLRLEYSDDEVRSEGL